MLISWIDLLLIFLFFNPTGDIKIGTEGTAKYKMEATVRDYTALDGCRFLLELKDGTRLLPVELSNPDFLFSEGQLVKISYSEVKGLMTTCMSGAMTVKLECIEEIKPGEKKGQLFIKKECFDTQAPLTIAWMNKAILRNRVSEVKKGYLQEEPQYVLFGNINVMVFSCTGQLICEYPLNTKSTCETPVENLKDLKSVWTQK